jgi:hypothetical protein
LKPAQANSSQRPYLEKKFHQNRASGVAQGEDHEFKPQYRNKTKKGRLGGSEHGKLFLINVLGQDVEEMWLC